MEDYIFQLALQGKFWPWMMCCEFEQEQVRRTYYPVHSQRARLNGSECGANERRLVQLEAANKVLRQRTEASNLAGEHRAGIDHNH
jgi:hypothetical protein